MQTLTIQVKDYFMIEFMKIIDTVKDNKVLKIALKSMSSIK